MTITPPVIGGFPVNSKPWGNITPFTYRDGQTHLEKLERMASFLDDSLIPDVNKGFEESYKEFTDSANEFVAEVNNLMAQWLSGQVENNDVITQAIINDSDSLTASAIRAVFSNQRPDVSIIDYGAINDAVDSTDAIVDAIAAAQSRGITDVYIPEGVYYVNSFTVPEGIRLTGNGTLIWRVESPAGVPFVTLYGDIVGPTLDGNRAANPRTNNRSQDAIVYIPAGVFGSTISARLINSPSSHIWGDVDAFGANGARSIKVVGCVLRNAKNYNVAVRGHDWIVTGNTVMGGTNGVRVGSFLSEFQATPNIQQFVGTIISNNTFIGTTSVPFEIEINSSGAIVTGNTVRLCNGVTKIQYQTGEPVYKTIFIGNTFEKIGYQVEYDDVTGTATQLVGFGMITSIPFGGFNTIVANNSFDDFAGIVLHYGAKFIDNNLLNVGADTVGQAGIRVASTSDGSIVKGNKFVMHSARQLDMLIRIDAPNVLVAENDITGGATVNYLARIYANGTRFRDNLWRASAGIFNAGNTIADTVFVRETFIGITNPYSGLGRNMPGIKFEDVRGAGVLPDFLAIVYLDASGNLIVGNSYKMGVGTLAGAAAGNLNTISAGSNPGQRIVLVRRTSAEVVTVQPGGNILVGSPFPINSGTAKLFLEWDGQHWSEYARAA